MTSSNPVSCSACRPANNPAIAAAEVDAAGTCKLLLSFQEDEGAFPRCDRRSKVIRDACYSDFNFFSPPILPTAAPFFCDPSLVLFQAFLNPAQQLELHQSKSHDLWLWSVYCLF
jgi:hypothetical protein